MIESVDNHRSHQKAWASPKAGICRETGFWYRADLCVSGARTYVRFYSHHGSHNGYIWYTWVGCPSIILNWIWILVFDMLASVLYISSLRVKTFVTYESWGLTSLEVSSHWSNLHRGLKPQTWQDKWQSKILRSSQPTTHARKVMLVVSRRNQSMSILKVLKCFETRNNKNETMRTSAHLPHLRGPRLLYIHLLRRLTRTMRKFTSDFWGGNGSRPWAFWFGLRRL